MLIGWKTHKRFSSTFWLDERLLSGEESANHVTSYKWTLAMIDEFRWFPLKPRKILVKTNFGENFYRFHEYFGFA